MINSIVKTVIVEYVEKQIIPLYRQFDMAHNVKHVLQTIKNSMKIAQNYPVDFNMVYVIAAYHDVGLQKGRKDHEKNSAVYLLEDKNLLAFFSTNELQIMAEAIEDHRASNAQEPRSIYGKIVTDADNDLNYISILTRCLQHGLAHFPAYDKDTHFQRIVQHMADKYGYNGYLKIWLNFESDVRGLQEIRNKLSHNFDAMRKDFEGIWESLHL